MDAHIKAVPRCAQCCHRLGGGGQAQAREHIGGLRANQSQGRLFAERDEFHIVHDDEVVKMGEELLLLICGNHQFQRIAVTGDSQVALNAPLRVQHQVPCIGVAAQVVDGVGDHAAEPAEAVFAAHGCTSEPTQIVRRRAREQRRCFPFRRVQSRRGQNPSISGELFS